MNDKLSVLLERIQHLERELLAEIGKKEAQFSLERLNCGYCEYTNGVLAYVQEIAARTEQYWCPIKHAMTVKTRNSRYTHFLDFGDAEQYRKQIEQVRRDFRDIQGKEESRSETS